MNDLEKAKQLLRDSLDHLDHDFHWEESAEYERRVREFLKESDHEQEEKAKA